MDKAYQTERIALSILINSREAFRFTHNFRDEELDDRVVELELQVPGRFDYQWSRGDLPWQESESVWPKKRSP